MKPISQPTSRTTRLALAAVVASLALATTACGGDKAAAGGAAPDAKPVTLTYWGWAKGAQATVDAFNKTHKNIQVKYSEIAGGPDGYSKITNAVKAGNAPDVAGIEYTQLPEFASQGLLEDLTEQAGDTVKQKFPASIQNLVTFGGKTWAVPYDVAPQLYYYRTDLFQKYGIAVPKTWAEFKTAGEKLQLADKNVHIASWADNDAVLLAALAWQGGGKWFSTEGDAWKVGINDAASQKVASYWQGLVDSGVVNSIPAGSEDETKARTSGTVASFIGASWSAGGMTVAMPKLSGKWGIAPLPTWDGKPASGGYGGTTYAVPKGSKHVKEAAEFSRWVTTDAAAVTARLSSLTSPSSALPANVEMRDVAAKAFKGGAYYAGFDVYKIAGAQVDTIVPGWTFGPVQIATNTAITDAAAKGNLTQGLTAGQASAEKGIKERGLNLVK